MKINKYEKTILIIPMVTLPLGFVFTFVLGIEQIGKMFVFATMFGILLLYLMVIKEIIKY